MIYNRLIYLCSVAFVFFFILKIVLCSSNESTVEEDSKYHPTWKSLATRPLPKWYDAAKIGIFIHWGVYSVPAVFSEQFWGKWKSIHGHKMHNYMTDNFKPGFTYQEFARDFTAELFNPAEWASIFEQSGAKYVVLTSKHHDGYALWPSKYSYSWNSVDVGPHRDIVADLSNAIRRKTNLTFGLYHSLFEWFHPLYLSDKQSRFKKNEFVTSKIIPELKELVNTYKPDVIWSDGAGEARSEYWKSTEFIAWLYNESPVRETVVTNDRWGKDAAYKHGDFLSILGLYSPRLIKHKWENAFSIDKYSWGNRGNSRLDDFMTSEELIEEIVKTVSCNGNILINIGPSRTGMIDPIFVDRLREMGKWLKVNGEAIYESSPWIYQNDTKTPDVWYTTKNNLDHNNSNRHSVYAIVLDYPFDSNSISLYALGGKFDNDTKVTMLGVAGDLKWNGSEQLMDIKFPEKTQIDKLDLKHAWTFKIDIPRQT